MKHQSFNSRQARRIHHQVTDQANGRLHPQHACCCVHMHACKMKHNCLFHHTSTQHATQQQQRHGRPQLHCSASPPCFTFTGSGRREDQKGGTEKQTRPLLPPAGRLLHRASSPMPPALCMLSITQHIRTNKEHHKAGNGIHKQPPMAGMQSNVLCDSQPAAYVK